jgi:PleD family two-component response regulator
MSPGAHHPLVGGVSPRAEGALAQLFRQADAKLYEAKRDGRNRVELAMA